jgi:hypothetical protein
MRKQSTVRILRATLFGLVGLGAAGWLSASLMAGEQATGKATHAMPVPGNGTMTKEQKIANAMTAAPAAVSGKATILDWPAKEGDQPAVLRAGSNGWNCLPDMPETQGSDPMCVDQSWMEWVAAYLAHRPPQITSVGIGYMIAPGGAWGSNTDPYAMAAAAGNQWHLAPPHLMILVPDLKSLAGVSTDPHHGGPYVMFPGTPYAHIMAPVAAPPASPSSRLNQERH